MTNIMSQNEFDVKDRYWKAYNFALNNCTVDLIAKEDILPMLI